MDFLRTFGFDIIGDNKFFAVMLFMPWDEIMDEYPGTEYVYVNTLEFDNGMYALDNYSQIPCPASQFIMAKTHEELKEKEEQMKENFKNEKWLEENLYPYL